MHSGESSSLPVLFMNISFLRKTFFFFLGGGGVKKNVNKKQYLPIKI
jgi:hypothetical protein